MTPIPKTHTSAITSSVALFVWLWLLVGASADHPHPSSSIKAQESVVQKVPPRSNNAGTTVAPKSPRVVIDRPVPSNPKIPSGSKSPKDAPKVSAPNAQMNHVTKDAPVARKRRSEASKVSPETVTKAPEAPKVSKAKAAEGPPMTRNAPKVQRSEVVQPELSIAPKSVANDASGANNPVVAETANVIASSIPTEIESTDVSNIESQSSTVASDDNVDPAPTEHDTNADSDNYVSHEDQHHAEDPAYPEIVEVSSNKLETSVKSLPDDDTSESRNGAPDVSESGAVAPEGTNSLENIRPQDIDLSLVRFCAASRHCMPALNERCISGDSGTLICGCGQGYSRSELSKVCEVSDGAESEFDSAWQEHLRASSDADRSEQEDEDPWKNRCAGIGSKDADLANFDDPEPDRLEAERQKWLQDELERIRRETPEELNIIDDHETPRADLEAEEETAEDEIEAPASASIDEGSTSETEEFSAHTSSKSGSEPLTTESTIENHEFSDENAEDVESEAILETDKSSPEHPEETEVSSEAAAIDASPEGISEDNVDEAPARTAANDSTECPLEDDPESIPTGGVGDLPKAQARGIDDGSKKAEKSSNQEAPKVVADAEGRAENKPPQEQSKSSAGQKFNKVSNQPASTVTTAAPSRPPRRIAAKRHPKPVEPSIASTAVPSENTSRTTGAPEVSE